MDFLDDTNRRHDANFFQRQLEEGCWIERRMVFRGKDDDDPESLDEAGEGITGDPEIDGLLDEFGLKLILLREEKERLQGVLSEAKDRKAVHMRSSEARLDLMKEIRDGAAIEEIIDKTTTQMEDLEAKMADQESLAALQRFKEDFTEMVRQIMETKADATRAAIEDFIDSQPSYLERLEKDPTIAGDMDEDIERDTSLDLAWEILRELESGERTIEEVKGEYEFYSEGIDEASDEEAEIKEEYDLSLRALDEARYVEYLTTAWLPSEFIRLIMRDRSGQLAEEGMTLGYALELTVATILEESTVPEYDEENDEYREARFEDGHLPDGPIAEFQGIIANIAEQDMTWEDFDLNKAVEWGHFDVNNPEDWEALESGDFSHAIAILPPDLLDYMKVDMPGVAEDYKAEFNIVADQLEEVREERYTAAEDKIAYQWAIKSYEEKENAREIATHMFDEIDQFQGDMFEMYDEANGFATTGERFEALRGLSYRLAGIDEFLDHMQPPEGVAGEPTSIDNLFSEYEAFDRGQIPFNEVYENIASKDPSSAQDIEGLVRRMGEGNVYFVPQSVFDGFFNGKTEVNGEAVDNLQGGEGAFFNGRIILVYEPSEGIDVRRIKEVLTHESIHFAMHEQEDLTNGIITSLLYRGKKRDQGGLQDALAKKTWGAKMISAFMDTFSGDEFTDWVHARTGFIDSDVTFEDVINSEEVAAEVLQEIMTIYMTKRAIGGAASAYTAEYLNVMNEFYNSSTGNQLLSRFMPEFKKSTSGKTNVILGFDEGSGEAVAGSSETGGETKVATLGELEGRLNNVEQNFIVSSEELLQELYNVDDHNGILAGARDQLEDLRKELAILKGKQERGEDIKPARQRELDKAVKKLEEDLEKKVLKKLRDEKELREEVPEDEWGYFTRLYKKTTFVSVDDILKIFSQTWDYLKERREMRSERVSSEVGKGLMPTQRMRAHFEGLEQAAQNRDVSQWKEKYDGKDPDTIDKVLALADDPNQIKALFEIKASTNGDFFFRDVLVREALQRATGRKIVTYAQSKQAFDDLFGIGEAEQLERQNSSTRSGKVSESEEMGKQHAKDLGAQWMEMIIAKEKDKKWVDSAKFEGFIHYALNAGKSYNKQVVWMIAKGYQLGILDHKTLIEMGGSALIGRSPYIEYMGELAQAAEDGKKFPGTNISELEYLARLDLFDENGDRTDWDPKASGEQLDDWRKFDDWFINYAPTRKGMIERREKLKSSTDNMDHDYIQDIWWDYEIASYDPIFNEQTGARQMIQHPGIANVYGQFLVNSLHWDDTKLSGMFSKWFRVDQLLTEENYETENGEFVMSGDKVERKKKNNRTVLQPSSFDITGAMFGSSIRDFRNATYQAYKRYAAHGDMAGARDYMMAAMIFYGESTWTPKSTIRYVYESKGWGERWTNVEQMAEEMQATFEAGNEPIPEAPVSHTILFNSDSMTKDLGDAGIEYRQGIK